MSKDPAFLFYSSDFLSGIQDLTMEERGQYITLLSLQHQKGHLSEKIIKLSVGNAAADVMAKFRQDSAGLWYNDRLEKEAEKRAAHAEKQRQRALDGWKKRKKEEKQPPNDSPGNAAALPLEDINEDVNESNNTNRVISKNEIFEELFTDEIWIEQINRTHKGKDIKQAWEECYSHHSANPNSKRFQTWEWKQKLNTWLTIKKTENGKQNGLSKKEQHTASLIEAHAKRWGSDATK